MRSPVWQAGPSWCTLATIVSASQSTQQLGPMLHMAAGVALAPELLARTAPIHHAALAERAFERGAVGPGDHEHVTGVGVLGHDRDQAAVVVGQRVEIHGRAVRFGRHGQRLTGRSWAASASLIWAIVRLAEVQRAGGEDRVGAALGERRREVIEFAGAAAGDHRNPHGLTDGAQQRQVVAVAGAVTVHRRQQHLARASLRGGFRPPTRRRRVRCRFGPRPRRPPRPRGLSVVGVGSALGVDRHHHALGAEPVGTPLQQCRVAHGGAVQRDLVGAGAQQLVDVVVGLHAAAHGERDEHLLGGLGDHVQGRRRVLRPWR